MAERWERERGFGERAADEVRSWMGDDDAQRRRQMDDAHDERPYRDRTVGREDYRDRDYRYSGGRSPVSYGSRDYPSSRPDPADYSLGPAYYPPRESVRSDYSRREFGRRDYSGGSYSGMAPRGYRRSDQRILEDVCDRLTDDPYVNPSDVEVKVNDGTVTLSGSVQSREEKRHAEDCVESVTGVRDVNNHLRVSSGVIGSPGAPQTPLNLSSPGGESRQVVNTEAEPTRRR